MADEVGLLQSHEGPEGVLFRRIAEQGHYAGRTVPSATRQGIYAAAPGGKLLGSINSSDPEAVAEMLRGALDRWKALPKAERLLGAMPEEKGRFRHEWSYPEGGLVLRTFTRDLPRAEGAADERTGRTWNRDFAWFKREEAALLVPAERKAGASRALPRPLAVRLAMLHLVDNVRGQTVPYAGKDVERAELTSTVTAVEGDVVKLRLEGATRAVARGRWSVGGFRDDGRPSEQERGFETKLLGRAEFDAAKGRFRRFEMLAVGTRWGATQYNGRTRDRGPAPIGVFFELAGDSPAERVAPAFAWAYAD